MIYKMDLKDSSDTMTFNLLETPIVDKDIEGAVDNVTLDGNQYTDYLYLKKQYIQKWAIMCPDEYDELRGFYTRQFEEGEVPSYRFYYGANVTRDYTFNGDYFQFNAEGIETGMTLSQLTGNAEQTTYSGKNLFSGNFSQFDNQGGTGSTYAYFKLPTDGVYTLSLKAKNTITASNHYLGFSAEGGSATNYKWTYQNSNATAGQVFVTTNVTGGGSILGFVFMYPTDSTTLQWFVDNFEIQLEAGSTDTAYEPYVGGIPAPNPNYPQPISTVTGEQNIEVVGKNLYNNDLPLDNKYLDASGNWATSTYSYINQEFNIQPSTTYTWSVTSKTGAPNLRFGEFDASGTFIRRTLITATNQTITTTATTASVKLSADRTDQNKFNECQLEEGSTATAYEPYQGQSYEVNLGKNLLYATELPKTQSNVTATYQDGIFGLSGTSATETNLYILPASQSVVHLEAGESITMYIERVGGTSKVYFTGYFEPDDGSATDYNWGLTLEGGASSIKRVKTASKAGNLTHARMFINANTTYDSTVKILVQKGNISNPSWAEYFPPIELAKIGNYQDRIYKNDGKWYIEKQVGKVVLNGSENWGMSGTNYYTEYFKDKIIPIPGTTQVAGLSNNFLVVGWNYQNPNVLYFHPNLAMQVQNANYPTLSDWVTWLASNPTTVYYALATPTTTEITNETLLSQLNFLASLYEGENNISLVGTGAQGEMEVFIRDVMSVETDVVPEVPVRLTLTDDGVINACGCRRNVQLTMRETTE